MRRYSKVVKGLVAAGLAIGLVGGTSAAANARVTYTEANGVNIRSAATTASSINGVGYSGQQVTDHWVVTGQNLTAYSSVYGTRTSNKWIYQTNQATGVTGYVWIYLLTS